MLSYQVFSQEEIIQIKAKDLSKKEKNDIELYLQNKDQKSKYIQTIYQINLSHLIDKTGLDFSLLDDEQQKRLIYVAGRLTKHFLKRKLNLIENAKPYAFKPNIVFLDPHHHLNSIYVRDKPELLNLLPNFGAIYTALRGNKNPNIEYEFRSQQNILIDTQFFGNPPTTLKAPNKKMILHPTVGYLRGEAIPLFKGGEIENFAKKNKNVCRSCDMCGKEDFDSLEDIEAYISLALKHHAHILRFHIGETALPKQGKKNTKRLLNLLKSKLKESYKLIPPVGPEKSPPEKPIIRLGHGTHMGIDSMMQCKKEGYFVEACLSSNKETGIIGKRKEYPLGLMLLLDVKVVLGTDGDLYYTDLKTEYAHAHKIIVHFLDQINFDNENNISLANGDKLKYKHIKKLFKDVPEAQDWDRNRILSFKDLCLIKEKLKEKINIDRLLKNMEELKEKIFPESIEKSAPKKTDSMRVTGDFPITKVFKVKKKDHNEQVLEKAITNILNACNDYETFLKNNKFYKNQKNTRKMQLVLSILKETLQNKKCNAEEKLTAFSSQLEKHKINFKWHNDPQSHIFIKQVMKIAFTVLASIPTLGAAAGLIALCGWIKKKDSNYFWKREKTETEKFKQQVLALTSANRLSQ